MGIYFSYLGLREKSSFVVLLCCRLFCGTHLLLRKLRSSKSQRRALQTKYNISRKPHYLREKSSFVVLLCCRLFCGTHLLLRHCLKNTVFLFFLLLLAWPSFAQAANREQRQLFWQARHLVMTGQYQRFASLAAYLKDYPLYPYLIFIKLKQQLSIANRTEIDHFLQTYKDTPLASKLRRDWLIYLAQKQDWPLFIHYYQPIYAVPLQCHYLNALLATQQKELAMQKIATLWLHVHTVPSVCRAPFNRWERLGGLNQALIWKKVAQAIPDNNVTLLQHLAQFLSSEQKTQLKQWYQVQHNPWLVEQSARFDGENAIARKILLFGLQRLAAKDPVELAETWPLLCKTYVLTEAEQQTLLAHLAINLAIHGNESAGDWLKRVKPHYANVTLREWRIRNSLLNGQWDKVLYWLDQLPREEQQQACWRYWRARALAATQKNQAAETIYRSLAKEVDYYGVLASQRLKLSYQPMQQHIAGDGYALAHLMAIQRAKELFVLGFVEEARREWQWALSSMNKGQLQAAAQLAKQWGWYDLAIIAAKKGNIHNDIKLRFPFAYRRAVLTTARRNHLNSAWVWAIMRQESAFRWDARSSAGALGLMQIMPRTGRQLAQQLSLRRLDLLDPQQNIKLGSTYLRQLLKLFSGNAILATASYNVGPTRIKHYQALYQRLPQDIWVEILPWKETREYVKSVCLARHIYSLI